MNESILIFGYGSLMNPRSLALTLPGARAVTSATLRDYRRVCNAPVNGYAYLNLEVCEGVKIEGVLVQVWLRELPALLKREKGYDFVNVTKNVQSAGQSAEVFAFIAVDGCREDLLVPRSYLETCLSEVGVDAQAQMLKEARIPAGIYEDLDSPVYQNYVSK